MLRIVVRSHSALKHKEYKVIDLLYLVWIFLFVFHLIHYELAQANSLWFSVLEFVVTGLQIVSRIKLKF